MDIRRIKRRGQHGSIKSSVSLISALSEVSSVSGSSTISKTILHPWPEWNDADINSEHWDKVGKLIKHKTFSASSVLSLASQLFEDSHPVNLLPNSLQAVSWKRPADIFDHEKIILYQDNAEEFDITTCNVHLFHSEIMSSIIAAISSLHYLGSTQVLAVEEESVSFHSNTTNLPWKPWHHIYSLCNAGKGTAHRPQLNPLGKYYVRLFFLGCWRRITVDDNIPVDLEGNILLPCSSIKNELWPIILSKAILKLASMSWNDESEVVEFSVMSCLTAWHRIVIDTENWTCEQFWEFCKEHVRAYKYPDETDEEQPRNEDNLHGSFDDKTPIRTSDMTSWSSKTSLRMSRGTRSILRRMMSTPFTLTVVLNDTDVYPSWTHEFLIEETRDIPLQKPDEIIQVQPWKRFRWVDWAKKTGIPNPEEMIKMKYLKVISNFKKLPSRFVEVSQTPPRRASLIPEYIPLEENMKVAESPNKAKPLIPKVSLKSRKQILPERSPAISVRIASTNGRGKMVSLRAGSVAFETSKQKEPTPSEELHIWAELNKIKPFVKKIYLYRRPSTFSNNVIVSDLCFGSCSEVRPQSKIELRHTKGLHSKAYFKYSLSMNRTRNETLHCFLDSCETKELLLTLSVLRTRTPTPNFQCPALQNEQSSFISVLIELYNWRDVIVREPSFKMCTRGTTTTTLQLSEGRHVLRMWFSTNASFVFQWLSPCAVSFGFSDRMLDLMSHESSRVEALANHLSSKFSNIYHMFGKPDFSEAVREFYNVVYKASSGPKYRTEAYELLMNEVVNFIKERSSRDKTLTVAALRVVFMDLDLGRKKKITESKMVFTSKEEENKHNKALIIQAVFKRFMLKVMKEQRNPCKKGFNEIFENIKIIKDDIFQIAKKSAIPNIMRNILIKNPNSLTIFPLCEDFKYTVNIEEWKGSIGNVNSRTWIPIMRIVLHCHGQDVTATIRLVCNFPAHIVHVVNNDTFEEIPRLSVNPDPYMFYQNRNGYTVFSYGWAESVRTKEWVWRLQVCTPKYSPAIHSCIKSMGSPKCTVIKPPTLSMNELRHFYIPNADNLLCRCTIKLKQRPLLLSFRLSVSYPEAEFSLVVLDKFGKKLTEVEGMGSVVIPAVYLETYTRISVTDAMSKELNYYILEAYVLRNSWPLTVSEWFNIWKVKLKGETLIKHEQTLKGNSNAGFVRPIGSRRSRISAQARSTRRLSNDCIPESEKPCWVLQTVYDAQKNPPIITRDRGREEMLKQLKKEWDRDDPGRNKRGADLRKTFLENKLKTLPLFLELSKVHSLQEPSDDGKRFLEPPMDWGRKNFKLILNEYLTLPCREPTVMTRSSLDLQNKRQKLEIAEFEEYYAKLKKERTVVNMKEEYRNKRFESFVNETINESRKRIAEAYLKRDLFVRVSPIWPKKKSKLKKGKERILKRKALHKARKPARRKPK